MWIDIGLRENYDYLQPVHKKTQIKLASTLEGIIKRTQAGTAQSTILVYFD